ncbi:hypothetical protein E2562_038269 [Oryza meyeriana var. granulata]|uniref:Uncharacterized protein n=1 Tax=Oryza meyeriana var. granulata TaxID=110450 RepID=A0A6G1F232_9ORYZ|nr:hypothetical protein E2562_038269 [Oryza meyeriana var. granulata]
MPSRCLAASSSCCRLAVCELQLALLFPRLEDGEGVPLALEFPQGIRGLLPRCDGLDTFYVQGGVFLFHLGHVMVVNRLGHADKRLQLLAPFLEVGLLCG